MKFLCSVCNIFVYNSENGDPLCGIAAGLLPRDFPTNWRCPVCGSAFEKLIEIIDEVYQKRFSAYQKFTDKKLKERVKEVKSILVGADNSLVPEELKQEYGKPLGLRGIGLGLSYFNNLSALAKIKLKTRLIKKHQTPKIEKYFFGKKLTMPILGASMSGMSFVLDITEEDFAHTILEGCRQAGTIGFTGNTSKPYNIHPGIWALKKVRGWGINIFKPQSQEVLLELIKQAEKEKAAAVGVDLDGAGSVNFTLAGKPVFRKAVEELKELKKATKLPFIVKGIMSSEDALSAVAGGADVISVSNHGGRVLDSTPGTAEVLPEIVRAVRAKNKKIIITVDGGVRTGFDVLKMLALGADFVLVGRPLAREISEGPEGVKRVLEFFKEDLVKGMILTGCDSLDEISEEIIWRGK